MVMRSHKKGSFILPSEGSVKIRKLFLSVLKNLYADKDYIFRFLMTPPDYIRDQSIPGVFMERQVSRFTPFKFRIYRKKDNFPDMRFILRPKFLLQVGRAGIPGHGSSNPVDQFSTWPGTLEGALRPTGETQTRTPAVCGRGMVAEGRNKDIPPPKASRNSRKL